MARYPIVIENSESNYSAYAPDVPGCGAVGSTVNETVANMAKALSFHLECLREDGEPVPAPGTSLTYVDIAA